MRKGEKEQVRRFCLSDYTLGRTGLDGDEMRREWDDFYGGRERRGRDKRFETISVDRREMACI